MGRLCSEGRTAVAALLKRGHSPSAVARLLGVTEGAVRYHRRRRLADAVDGRSRQESKASGYSMAIAHWRSQQEGGRVNLAALHAWLREEHGYTGSLKSVQRYWARTYPMPVLRARRRVETPIGAQVQIDWAEFPMTLLGQEIVDLSALVMTLSWSRRRVAVWSRSKDQLSWQSCHLRCFERLGGVAAVARIDNVKTALSRGAGAWGELNPTYRRFADQLCFHIDACPPRQPRAKGKVERSVLDVRTVLDLEGKTFDDLAALQAWTDHRLDERAEEVRCPATGTSVAEAWEQERRLLTPLPATLPEPFDIVVRRPVGDDCTISFEGRRYSVPFRFIRQEVEVRGLAGRVQVLKHCQILADHPRGTAELVQFDPRHFDGPNSDQVIAPPPLGRMGRKLEEIVAAGVQQRSLDLYAMLAEVAR